MATVFVDTVAWIALLNTSDGLHSNAQQTLRTLRSQKVRLITTEFVLLEVADALSSLSIRMKTVTFIDGLRKMSGLQIVPASQTLLMEGWTLYGQRQDKEWGLTDCISFVVMDGQQVTQAFTSDHHFTQAGFTCLL
jgi:uncharacterized protein